MPRKLCINDSYSNGAIHGYNYCRKHGGGKRCTKEGCTKSARGSTGKCVEHGGNQCSENGCTKGAQNKSNKCILHGGGNRCIEKDCDNSAIGKTHKCKKHGGGKRCIHEGCNKSSQGSSSKCVEHGGGYQCIQTGCTTTAHSKNAKCKKHGGGNRCIEVGCTRSTEGINDKCLSHGGGNRCQHEDCKKGARGKTGKCVEHGGGKRCPNCIDWIDSRSGTSKYDGYCATCFKRIFPNDERSKVIHIHTKEIRVRNEINKYFEGFIHDKPLYTGNCDCTHRRRIDHRKLIENTLLCIETDEFGHAKYNTKDEEIRYDDLFMIHSSKWIFIRFNPDGKGIDMEDKLNVLIEEITKQIERIKDNKNTELFEIIKMYF